MPGNVSSCPSLRAALLGALSIRFAQATATGTLLLADEGSRTLPARRGQCLLQESLNQRWRAQAFKSPFSHHWERDLPPSPERPEVEMTFVDMGLGVCQTVEGGTPNFQERPSQHPHDCQIQCGGEPGCAGFSMVGISCLLYFEGPLRASGSTTGEAHCQTRIFPNQQEEAPQPADSQDEQSEAEVIRPQSETSVLADHLSEAEAEANRFRDEANQSESQVAALRQQVQEAQTDAETVTRDEMTHMEDKLRASEEAMEATSSHAIKLEAKLQSTQRELEEARGNVDKAKHEAEGYRAQLARVAGEMQQYKNRTNATEEEAHALRHRLAEVTGIAKKWHRRAKKLERKLRAALAE